MTAASAPSPECAANTGGRELRAAAGDTFEAIALEWYKVNRPQWTSARHAQNILVALRTYVISRIGHFSVGTISPLMITDLLTAKELKGKEETARRVRQYIGAVFGYAIRTGRGTYNPALVTAQIGKGRQVVHRPALPQSMIGEFLSGWMTIQIRWRSSGYGCLF